MNEGSWKLIDLLNTAAEYLAEKEIEHPRRNAEALLGKALSIPRIELYLQYDRPLLPEEVGHFRAMIRRRLNHEPLQQILGEVEFLGCRLTTPKGLLVPRPETELLASIVVELANKTFAKSDKIRICDLGCGTGCLSIALASSLPTASVEAIDIDPLAVETTKRNAEINGVEARMSFVQADMLDDDFYRKFSTPFDIIISNPPYVRESDYDNLAPEIRNFENSQALVGGADGLKYYRRIAVLLPKLLSADGFAALELGI